MSRIWNKHYFLNLGPGLEGGVALGHECSITNLKSEIWSYNNYYHRWSLYPQSHPSRLHLLYQWLLHIIIPWGWFSASFPFWAGSETTTMQVSPFFHMFVLEKRSHQTLDPRWPSPSHNNLFVWWASSHALFVPYVCQFFWPPSVHQGPCLCWRIFLLIPIGLP